MPDLLLKTIGVWTRNILPPREISLNLTDLNLGSTPVPKNIRTKYA